MKPAVQGHLSTPMVLLMAAASGLAVAGNYYAQPLLHGIGTEFGLSNASAGSIVTTAQLSYALGLMLLVPLGDMLERRKLIAVMTAMSALGLLVSSQASSAAMLLAGTALSALLSVVAQVLVPYAATLASPEQRGKAVGTVTSGLLLGILLARTVAGALADLGGWRTVYWVSALLMLCMAALLWRALPSYHQPAGLSYPRLLASIFQLYRQEPLFRARSLLGAAVFASFSMFWTPLTFLLSSPAYGYSTTAIGLFGLAGAAGAYGANYMGRLADRGLGNRATLAALALLAFSWIPTGLGALGGHWVWMLLGGTLLLDLAIQGVHVTNQSAIYRLRPEARSRLAAGYMTTYFIGGASGSLASSWIYSHAGWTGVCLAGGVVGLLALAYARLVPGARIPQAAPAS